MKRVHIICEGTTEENFVNQLLLLPLQQRAGIYCLPSTIGRPGKKGGDVSYARLMVDLREHLLRDRQSWASTFMDYYGLPADFPGKVASQKYRSTADKSASLLAALSERLTADLGPEPLRRFIPYVQMHEFEGLLFSHPVALAQGLGQPKLADAFAKIRADFPTPEEINDSPESAPSKRLEQLSPGYTKQKAHLGLLAAHAMGLPAIRQSCGLFDAWLSRLESLGTQQP